MNWKRCGAEALGTFLIVLAPSLFSATSTMQGGDHGILAAAFVSGLAVLAAIYALGPICGAHFNPAVTLAFAATNHFAKKDVIGYWIAQFMGAILASGLTVLLFGPGYGVHIPNGQSVAQNLGIEIILTFVLMFVIISVATDKRVSNAVPGLAIGLTVVVGVLIGGPITGGSMNPARSLGPALFSGGEALRHVWLYLVAPPIGALLGAFTYELVRADRRVSLDSAN